MMLLRALLLIACPLLVTSKRAYFPQDCTEIQRHSPHSHSGTYFIYPAEAQDGVEVYCDMETEGGGWTVIQRRMDGSVSFYRHWDRYKNGFGPATGEYWLGLNNIHFLTHNVKSQLIVSMSDEQQKNTTALYDHFTLESECDGYAFHLSGFHDRGAGKELSYFSGKRFAPYDEQGKLKVNCTQMAYGGFWFNKCHQKKEQGIVRLGDKEALYLVGMDWFHWSGHDFSIKKITMMIRRVD